MNLTEKELEDIFDILDFFDFEQVAKVMKFLEWEWMDYATPRIPDVIDLRKKARRILFSCAAKCKEEGQDSMYQSGGFYCLANMVDGKLTIELQFILTEFNNFE